MGEHSLRARAAALAGAVLVVAFGVHCATHSVDFPIYHRIATQVLQGNYDLYPDALTPHGFRYAPATAWLFAPLGLLPLEASAFLFYLLKVAAYAYMAAVVVRRAGAARPAAMLALAALLCVAGYVVEEFKYGNVHVLAIALMVFAFDAAERGRVAAPAAAMALAIATKLTPVLLLGYFAMRRRFAVCAAAVLALVVLALAPAAIVGWSKNVELHREFVTYAAEKVDETDNYSLRGALARTALPPETVSTIWIASVAIGGVAVAAFLWRRPASEPVRLLEFSIVLTAMLLASPHTQRRYFTALYVPVLALIALLVNDPRRRERRPIVFGLAATAAASTVLPLVFGGRRLAMAYESASPYFFATLGLLLTLLAVVGRLNRIPAGAVLLPDTDE